LNNNLLYAIRPNLDKIYMFKSKYKIKPSKKGLIMYLEKKKYISAISWQIIKNKQLNLKLFDWVIKTNLI